MQDDSSGSDDEVRPKRKSGADFLRDLEAKYGCDKHGGGACFVLKDGEHAPLGNNALSLWSLLMVRDIHTPLRSLRLLINSQAQGAHTSDTVPPSVLNLNLEGTKAPVPTRRANKTGIEAEPHHHPHYPYYPPPPHVPYPPYYPPHAPPHQPHPAVPEAALPAPAPAPIPAIQTTLRKGISLDSQDDENPTDFPKVEDWLLELDGGDRGEDGHGFYLFGPPLRQNGYTRIVQLLDESVDSLRKICGDMPLGTAKLILKYAKQDCKKIRRVEAERKKAWAAQF